MSEEQVTSLVEIWNELQNVKLRLIRIEEKADEFYRTVDEVKKNFLLALEEYEREVINGKNS